MEFRIHSNNDAEKFEENVNFLLTEGYKIINCPVWLDEGFPIYVVFLQKDD